MDNEVWKPVIGFEGQYEVSNKGRVRGLDRVLHFMRGKTPVERPHKGQLIGLNVDKRGRVGVFLTKRLRKSLHRVVLEAFIGPCPPGCEGCHKNDNQLDNRLDNLYWGTKAQNWSDAKRNGKIRHGSDVSTAKLTSKDVKAIRRLLKNHTGVELGAAYGVSPEAVYAIKNGKSWRHVV